MFSIIYVRSIVGVAAIAGMMCYLGVTESLTEAIAGIVAVVYIDRSISGDVA